MFLSFINSNWVSLLHAFFHSVLCFFVLCLLLCQQLVLSRRRWYKLAGTLSYTPKPSRLWCNMPCILTKLNLPLVRKLQNISHEKLLSTFFYIVLSSFICTAGPCNLRDKARVRAGQVRNERQLKCFTVDGWCRVHYHSDYTETRQHTEKEEKNS